MWLGASPAYELVKLDCNRTHHAACHRHAHRRTSGSSNLIEVCFDVFLAAPECHGSYSLVLWQ